MGGNDVGVTPASAIRPLTLADLQDVPLVTFGEGRSVGQVEAFVRSRGVDLNVVFRSNYNGTVQGLAAGGGVAALAPLLTMDMRLPVTTILGPISELPPRVIGLAWHRDRFRARSLDAFVETARTVCEELAHAGEGLLRPDRARPSRPQQPLASPRREHGRPGR
jgi:DNA-binding transcriptional LysR family regulator